MPHKPKRTCKLCLQLSTEHWRWARGLMVKAVIAAHKYPCNHAQSNVMLGLRLAPGWRQRRKAIPSINARQMQIMITRTQISTDSGIQAYACLRPVPHTGNSRTKWTDCIPPVLAQGRSIPRHRSGWYSECWRQWDFPPQDQMSCSGLPRSSSSAHQQLGTDWMREQ